MRRALNQTFRRIAHRPWAELGITAAYLVLAALWIVLSDRALDEFAGDQPDPVNLQTLKGLNFVVTTAGLLYLTLRHTYARRRTAEDLALANARRFELAARATSDTVWELNFETRELWWSEGFSRILGEPGTNLAPTVESWIDRLHPEDADRVRHGFRTASQSDASRWSDEFRFRRSDGSYALVTACGHLVRDDQGNPLRLIGAMSDVTARRAAEHDLESSRERLRALSARLQTLREEERSTIAREIHDELGQLLTGVRMCLRWAEDRLEQLPASPQRNPVLDRLVEATDLTDQVIASIRRIAASLRPAVLDDLGLLNAIRFETDRLARQADLRYTLSLPNQLPPLALHTRTGVFRVFQEAFTNVLRHAHTKDVEVSFRLDGDQAQLEIRDHGVGIPPDAICGGTSLGLAGMHERARLLAGSLQVQRADPSGTRVTLRFPLTPPTLSAPP